MEQPIHPESGGLLLKVGTRYDSTFRFCNRLVPGTYFVDITVRGTIGDQEIVLHGIRGAVVFQCGDGKGDAAAGFVDLLEEPEEQDVSRKSRKVKAS